MGSGAFPTTRRIEYEKNMDIVDGGMRLWILG